MRTFACLHKRWTDLSLLIYKRMNERNESIHEMNLRIFFHRILTVHNYDPYTLNKHDRKSRLDILGYLPKLMPIDCYRLQCTHWTVHRSMVIITLNEGGGVVRVVGRMGYGTCHEAQPRLHTMHSYYVCTYTILNFLVFVV